MYCNTGLQTCIHYKYCLFQVNHLQNHLTHIPALSVGDLLNPFRGGTISASLEMKVLTDEHSYVLFFVVVFFTSPLRSQFFTLPIPPHLSNH